MAPRPSIPARRALGGMIPIGGFTLLELLVVMGIMAVVAAISVGSLGGFQHSNRLLVGQHLMTDLVRQARHTARSTGMPVILRLTPSESPPVDLSESSPLDGSPTIRIIGGEISGLTQAPLASECFEDDIWHDPTDVIDGEPQYVMGRTGHGLRIKTDGDNILKWPSSLAGLRSDFAAADRSKRLLGGTRKALGFYLAAAVFLPTINTSINIGFQHLPLVMATIHKSDETPTPSVDNSVAGLMLRSHSRPVQRVDGPQGELNREVRMFTWEVLGWIGDGNGKQAMVSSIDDTIQQGAELHPTAEWNAFSEWKNRGVNTPDPFTGLILAQGTTARTVPVSLVPGQWLDCGLLFDGVTLTLFLDGVAVDRRNVTGTVSLPTTTASDIVNSLWYGVANLPVVLTARYSPEVEKPGGEKRTIFAANTLIDDVRLLRLGSTMPIRLPQGVRPFLPKGFRYELTALPDGRCQLAQVGDDTRSPVTELVLADVDDPTFLVDPYAQPLRQLNLTITSTGTVTGQLRGHDVVPLVQESAP